MNVDFESLVVLADDERIADAVEEAAERLNAASALADDEHGVEREGDVLFVEHGEIGLLLCILFGELGALLAAQGAEHTAENQQEALAARVDDAGLFEDGVLVDGIVERGVRGVQAVLEHVFDLAVFLGEVARVGIWEEACKMCGDCVLGTTGGICPITQCAKSLVNGPCGGQKNGKCEVNPENDCAWIQIYKRLEQLGQLDKLSMTRPDKGYEKVAYPRTINQRGKKA